MCGVGLYRTDLVWTPRGIALSAWVVFVVGVPSGILQPQFRLLTAVASGLGYSSADLLATAHSTATIVCMYTRPTNGGCLHRGSKQQAVRVLRFLEGCVLICMLIRMIGRSTSVDEGLSTTVEGVVLSMENLEPSGSGSIHVGQVQYSATRSTILGNRYRAR